MRSLKQQLVGLQIDYVENEPLVKIPISGVSCFDGQELTDLILDLQASPLCRLFMASSPSSVPKTRASDALDKASSHMAYLDGSLGSGW